MNYPLPEELVTRDFEEENNVALLPKKDLSALTPDEQRQAQLDALRSIALEGLDENEAAKAREFYGEKHPSENRFKVSIGGRLAVLQDPSGGFYQDPAAYYRQKGWDYPNGRLTKRYEFFEDYAQRFITATREQWQERKRAQAEAEKQQAAINKGISDYLNGRPMNLSLNENQLFLLAQNGIGRESLDRAQRSMSMMKARVGEGNKTVWNKDSLRSALYNVIDDETAQNLLISGLIEREKKTASSTGILDYILDNPLSTAQQGFLTSLEELLENATTPDLTRPSGKHPDDSTISQEELTADAQKVSGLARILQDQLTAVRSETRGKKGGYFWVGERTRALGRTIGDVAPYIGAQTLARKGGVPGAIGAAAITGITYEAARQREIETAYAKAQEKGTTPNPDDVRTQAALYAGAETTLMTAGGYLLHPLNAAGGRTLNWLAQRAGGSWANAAARFGASTIGSHTVSAANAAVTLDLLFPLATQAGKSAANLALDTPAEVQTQFNGFRDMVLQHFPNGDAIIDNIISIFAFGAAGAGSIRQHLRPMLESRGAYLAAGGDPKIWASTLTLNPEKRDNLLSQHLRDAWTTPANISATIQRATRHMEQRLTEAQRQELENDTIFRASLKTAGYDISDAAEGNVTIRQGGRYNDNGTYTPGKNSVTIPRDQAWDYAQSVLRPQIRDIENTLRESAANIAFRDAAAKAFPRTVILPGAITRETIARLSDRAAARREELLKEGKTPDDILREEIAPGLTIEAAEKLPEQYSQRAQIEAARRGLGESEDTFASRAFTLVADGEGLTPTAARLTLLLTRGAKPNEILEEMLEARQRDIMSTGEHNPVHLAAGLLQVREHMKNSPDQGTRDAARRLLPLPADIETRLGRGELLESDRPLVTRAITETLSAVGKARLWEQLSSQNAADMPPFVRAYAENTLQSYSELQQALLASHAIEKLGRTPELKNAALQDILGLTTEQAATLIKESATPLSKTRPDDLLKLYNRERQQAEEAAAAAIAEPLRNTGNPERVADTLKRAEEEQDAALNHAQDKQSAPPADTERIPADENITGEPLTLPRPEVNTISKEGNILAKEDIDAPDSPPTIETVNLPGIKDGHILRNADGSFSCALAIGNIVHTVNIPQFKRGARDATGTRRAPNEDGTTYELQGEARLSMPEIVVLHDKEGRYELVTGRHRLALAKKSGWQHIPARVYEKDTVQGGTLRNYAWARLFDIESNILDGQASAREIAWYFRENPMPYAEARRRGLINQRTDGEQTANSIIGLTLGDHTRTSEELYTRYINDDIPQKEAYEIASAISVDQQEKVLTLMFPADGKSKPRTLDWARAYLAAAEQMERSTPQQLDLLGFDHSFEEAQKKYADYVTHGLRTLDSLISTLNAAGKLTSPRTARALNTLREVTGFEAQLSTNADFSNLRQNLRQLREEYARGDIDLGLSKLAAEWDGKSPVNPLANHPERMEALQGRFTGKSAESGSLFNFSLITLDELLREENPGRRLQRELDTITRRVDAAYTSGKKAENISPEKAAAQATGRIMGILAALYKKLPDKHRPKLEPLYRRGLVYSRLLTGQLRTSTLINRAEREILAERLQKELDAQLATELPGYEQRKAADAEAKAQENRWQKTIRDDARDIAARRQSEAKKAARELVNRRQAEAEAEAKKLLELRRKEATEEATELVTSQQNSNEETRTQAKARIEPAKAEVQKLKEELDTLQTEDKKNAELAASLREARKTVKKIQAQNKEANAQGRAKLKAARKQAEKLLKRRQKEAEAEARKLISSRMKDAQKEAQKLIDVQTQAALAETKEIANLHPKADIAETETRTRREFMAELKALAARKIGEENLHTLFIEFADAANAAISGLLKESETARLQTLVRSYLPKKDKRSGKMQPGKLGAAGHRMLQNIAERLNASESKTQATIDALTTALDEARQEGNAARAQEIEADLASWYTYGNLQGMDYLKIREATRQLAQTLAGQKAAWQEKLADQKALTDYFIDEARRQGMEDIAQSDISTAARRDQNMTAAGKWKKLIPGFMSPGQLMESFSNLPGLSELAQYSRREISLANHSLLAQQNNLNKRMREKLVSMGYNSRAQRARFFVDAKRREKTNIILAPREELYQRKLTLEQARAWLALGKEGREKERQRIDAETRRNKRKREEALPEDITDALKAQVETIEREHAAANVKRREKGKEEKELPGSKPVTLRTTRHHKQETPLTLSRSEALQILLTIRQPRYQQSARAQGYSPEVEAALVKYIGSDLLEMGHWMQDHFAHDGLKEAFEEWMGCPFPAEEAYWPGKFDDSTFSIKNLGEDAGGNIGTFTNGYNFLKARTNHKLDIPQHQDAFSVFASNCALRQNYIAYHRICKQWASLLGNKPFARYLRKSTGETRFRLLKEGLSKLDAGGYVKGLVDSTAGQIISAIQSAHAPAVLGGSPTTLLKQYTGIMHATSLPGVNCFDVAAQILRDIAPGSKQEMTYSRMAKDPIYLNRHKNITNESFAGLMGKSGQVTYSRLNEWVRIAQEPMGLFDAWGNLASGTALYNILWRRMERSNRDGSTNYTREQMHTQCMDAVTRMLDLSAQPLVEGQKSINAMGATGFWKSLFYMGSESIKNVGMFISLAYQGNVGKNGRPSYWNALRKSWSWLATMSSAEIVLTALCTAMTGRTPAWDDDEAWATWAYINAAKALSGIGTIQSVPLLNAAFATTDELLQGLKLTEAPLFGYFDTNTLGDMYGTDVAYNMKRLYQMSTSKKKTYSPEEWALRIHSASRSASALAGYIGGENSTIPGVSLATGILNSANIAGNIIRPYLSLKTEQSKKAEKKKKKQKNLAETIHY